MIRLTTVAFGLVVAVGTALSGCSTAIRTVGVLDAPEKKQMYTAKTRTEFEALAGKPIASRAASDGMRVDLYEYVDGEANDLGNSQLIFSSTVFAILTAGLSEIMSVPLASIDRSEATSELYVIYASDNRILAICHTTVHYEPETPCGSEVPPVANENP